MSQDFNPTAYQMDLPRTARYEATKDLWILLVALYAQSGLALSLIALVSIAGVVALPVMIPAWIAARVYCKSNCAKSIRAAHEVFSMHGFTATRTLSPGGATLLIDEVNKAFSYWQDDVPVFQAGIALFEEISGVEWTKEGDIEQSLAPGVIVTARRGCLEFRITLNRINDTEFNFRCHSQRAAEKLMQQLSILADLR